MAYGTVKVDTIIFDQGGADQNVTVSGIYRAITSGVTVSGTISGAVLVGTTTVSGATVTGTQSSFTSGNFVTLSGATATFTSAVIASGTAAAPSLSIISDPNTGIYSPGADQLAVATNGTARLVIDANGTVTCTSAQPTDGSIRISNTTTRAPSNKYGIRFADSASETNAAIYAEQASSGNNASALVFGTNDGTGGGVLTSAAERLRITSAGLVGIGTSSPAVTLDVANIHGLNNSITRPFRLRNYGQLSATGYGVGMSFFYPNGTTSDLGFEAASIDSSYTAGGNFGNLIFSTNNNTGVAERLRIDSAGRVGIGTSSPNYQLHVTTDFAVGASGFNQQLTFGNDTIQSLLLGTGYTALKLNPLGGNVGIGTASPLTKLDVRSGVITAGSSSSTDGTEILRGYYSATDGALAVIGTEYSSGGIVIGSAVKPSTSASDAFLSSTTVNIARGAYTIAGNTHKWYIGAVQTVAENSSVSTSEAMRIDSSGRLLVGTSSARSIATQSSIIQNEGTSFGTTGFSTCRNSNDIYGSYIHFGKTRGASVGSNTIVASGDDLGGLIFGGADGTDVDSQAAYIVCQVDGTPGANDMPGRLVFSTTADGQSAPTERMRIDALGALKTSPNGTYKFSAGTTEITHNDATSTVQLTASSTGFTGDAVTISTFRNTVNDSYKFLSCIRQGFAVALEIRDDGDVYNVNGTYGSLSDVKLKENIVDANSQWDDIRRLRVRNYNFKPETNNSTHKQIGVIAQEIEDVSPGLVNTVPDRDEDGNDLGTVTKSVNYSVLYMKAVKALQEAMTRIETLEADVALLKSA